MVVDILLKDHPTFQIFFGLNYNAHYNEKK